MGSKSRGQDYSGGFGMRVTLAIAAMNKGFAVPLWVLLFGAEPNAQLSPGDATRTTERARNARLAGLRDYRDTATALVSV